METVPKYNRNIIETARNPEQRF